MSKLQLEGDLSPIFLQEIKISESWLLIRVGRSAPEHESQHRQERLSRRAARPVLAPVGKPPRNAVPLPRHFVSMPCWTRKPHELTLNSDTQKAHMANAVFSLTGLSGLTGFPRAQTAELGMAILVSCFFVRIWCPARRKAHSATAGH